MTNAGGQVVSFLWSAILSAVAALGILAKTLISADSLRKEGKWRGSLNGLVLSASVTGVFTAAGLLYVRKMGWEGKVDLVGFGLYGALMLCHAWIFRRHIIRAGE